MVEENAFQELIGRVRSGDACAADELVRLYEPAIRRAARIRLVDPRLRRVFDSMDVCQSVFASFFVRAALGQYELNKPEQLLKLLVSMSRKKLADHARVEGAARRDYRRLQTGDEAGTIFVDPNTSPGEQASARELLAEFRKRLSIDERQLADLRAEGCDWAMIAKKVGSTPEALRKKLTRAIERVGQSLGMGDIAHE